MPAIQCSSCSYLNILSGKYCAMCGNTITANCIVCGEENIKEAKFCRNCAAEKSKSVKGLLLDRGRAWSEQFWRMGWLNWNEISEGEKNLYQSELIPLDKYEIWIFGCIIDGKEMKPKLVRVNNKIFAASGAFGQRGFMIATRCRLGVFSVKSKISHTFWYKDIKSWSYKDSTVTLNINNGDTIQWELNPPSSAFADIVTALAATDPVARSWARHDINMSSQERKSFGDVIIDFLNDIFIAK